MTARAVDIGVLLVGALSLLLPADAAARHALPAAPLGTERIPLERVLNADGTLDLGRGFSGALDSTGWTICSGPPV